MQKELTQSVIEEWVALANGTFNVRDIWGELNVTTPEAKHHLRTIMKRIEVKNIVSCTRKDGTYRKVDSDLVKLDWRNADTSNVIPILFPFGLHEYVKIFPKSIIIVTADKNQGKTAFMYKTLELNAGTSMPDKDGNNSLDLFNSETGVEQMKERLLKLNLPDTFNTWERYDNFSDVIHPEHISLIDYLDMDSDVYMVGAEINKIFMKLTTGAAIIALQKPIPTKVIYKGQTTIQSRDLAYGGTASVKRSVLYITMGQQKLKLLYVKTPKNPKINPNNMMWSYDFDEDGYFTNIKRYYGEEDTEHPYIPPEYSRSKPSTTWANKGAI